MNFSKFAKGNYFLSFALLASYEGLMHLADEHEMNRYDNCFRVELYDICFYNEMINSI
jgi:hypothetical protein